MQSLFYLVLAGQLLAFTYSQAPKAPVNPKAPKAGPKAPMPPAPSFLIFDPPSMTFPQDSTAGIFVAASLSSQPKGTVSIHLEAPNLVFSRCKVTFTKKNWNNQQIVRVSPAPYLTDIPANREIKAKFCYDGKKDTDLHKSCQEYRVSRGKGNGGTCQAIGAGIQYTSFAGKRFDFVARDAFYLVKSGPLSVQQLNTPWMGTPRAVQTKVALRYYKTLYVFDVETKKAKLVSKSSEGVDITEAPGVSSRVALSDGSTVIIQYLGVKPHFHIRTVVTLGRTYRGKLSGLCGDIGNAKLIMPDGQTATNPALFGNAWKVAGDDNLFTLGAEASSVVKSKIVKKVGKSDCKIPDLENKNEDGNKVTE